ncbi:endo-1,3(4)-beta-glucanase 2-like [Dorcoceras hygrometricum]|uniref:Endo-1,3(4)-beta-glucanase 2-like n=1 Tax=Dorcoceras hygrometricum TaxID=472368 RepID=A0A2Z7AVU6_9LAMI|nr:endo-1,3(4)-beta-glucanase 2-like [Dorcoceras hygrometricum]
MLPDFTPFMSPCVLLAPPKTSILHAFHTRFLTRAKHLRAFEKKPDFRLRTLHANSDFEDFCFVQALFCTDISVVL